MIAMLLAAQLSAEIGRGMPADVVSPAKGELIRILPRPSRCFGGKGRMEVSFAKPTALYRKGDRPAKMYLRWIDYPAAKTCLTETAR